MIKTTSQMLSLTEKSTKKGSYDVYINTVYIGEIFQDVDGYYKYWPGQHQGGYWSTWMMQILIERLDEMNEPYELELEEYFERQAKDYNPDKE